MQGLCIFIFFLSVVMTLLLRGGCNMPFWYIIAWGFGIGMVLTYIGLIMPVETHTSYQHGMIRNGKCEMIPIKTSSTPIWQYELSLSFYTVPFGVVVGYLVYVLFT